MLAGVPSIMQAMAEGILPTLAGGPPIVTRTVSCTLAEGTLTSELGAIQERFPGVEIGSYPYFRNRRFGVSLVLRGTAAGEVEAATAAVCGLIERLGDTTRVTEGAARPEDPAGP